MLVTCSAMWIPSWRDDNKIILGRLVSTRGRPNSLALADLIVASLVTV